MRSVEDVTSEILDLVAGHFGIARSCLRILGKPRGISKRMPSFNHLQARIRP